VETIGDYRERAKQIWLHGVQPGKKVGWGEFDDLVQFEPGRSLIIVGEPNTGKSTFADDLILNLALLHGWKAALYSPEMFPPERHIDRLATAIAGRRFRREEVFTERGIDYRRTAIPEPMADRILDWMQENIFFVTEESGRTIHKLLHRAEQLQVRYGIRQLLLDPFNYIQLPDGAKSDTMKIGDVLAEIELFAHRTGILVIVVVHPSKPQKGEQIESLYNASGSAEFRNRADYGLVLAGADRSNRKGCPELHLLKVIVDKVRDDAMGHKGVCHLSFDPRNYRHGAVRTEHLTEQLNQLVLQPVSAHCWLDQAVEEELPF
jgi:twinkle protein